MRAYVKRVHRTGCRWDMKTSSPALEDKFHCIFFHGIAIANYRIDVPRSPVSDPLRRGREPRRVHAVSADLPVARERNLQNELLCRNRVSRSRVLPTSNAGARHAPAAVGAAQSMARLLSSSAAGRLDGVIDDGSDRGGHCKFPSPAISTACTKLPRRAPRPLAVVGEYAQPLPAGPHSPQFT